MKQTLFFVLLLVCFTATAQKQKKPNLNKALNAWRDGNLAEAKQIIDDATTYEKTKDDGKTWYYRGLIYASIDTTSNEEHKSLAENPLQVAVESFAKADQLGKAGSEYFVMTPGAVIPETKTQQVTNLANYYLNGAIAEYQDNADYDACLALLAKTINVFENAGVADYPNDTLAYYVQAVVAAENEQPELAIESVEKLYASGGTSRDGYLILYRIYSTGPTKDDEKALQIAREARAKFPKDPDFPKYELGLLIDLGRMEEAKTELQKAIDSDPDNKLYHFFLGYANVRIAEVERKAIDSLSIANMSKKDPGIAAQIDKHAEKQMALVGEARQSFEQALRVDPGYFEAQFYLANTYTMEIDKTTREYNSLPSNASTAKKRQELIQKRVAQSEEAIPHLEKALTLASKDDDKIDVLQMLGQLYYYTADDKNSARVANELKKLGFTDN